MNPSVVKRYNVSLVDMIDRFDGVERSLAVVNRTEPDPVQNMLVETFAGDHVDVSEVRSVGANPSGDVIDALIGDGGTAVEACFSASHMRDSATLSGTDLSTVENLVLLIEEEEIIAASPLDELIDTILLVNSDLYITGTRQLEDVDLPAVVSGLDETLFTLRGYPESNRQKLLLITISRFIERVAWRAGSGTLRSSFQRLSRLDDEVGTRRVYKGVSSTGVDTHVYGVADTLPDGLDVTVHAGTKPDFTDTWFVVYRPAGGPRVASGADSDFERGMKGGVALLAVETEPRLWQGYWTFDPGRLETIDRYIRTTL